MLASADAISEAIEAIRHNCTIPPGVSPQLAKVHALVAQPSTVVDVTTLYHDACETNKAYAVYEDSVIRPPWVEALFAYAQRNGDVVLAHVGYVDAEAELRWQPPGEVGHVIDWDRVRWVAVTSIWIATRGRALGPVIAYRLAVNEDGTVQDINWHLAFEEEVIAPIREGLDTAIMLVLKALTFLNCRNVSLATPERPRALRRRLQRADLDIAELRVHSLGRTVQGGGRSAPGEGVPLTTVRGHLARYGVEGRGLLFGKHAGTFWIPAHARGAAEHGRRRQRVTLET